MSVSREVDLFGDALRSIYEYENREGNLSTLKPPNDNSVSLSPEQVYQVVLSKLYTGNDTCAAIYEAKGGGSSILTAGQVIVANNTGNQEHFDRINVILAKITRHENHESIKAELHGLLQDKKGYVVADSEAREGFRVSETLRRDVDFIVDNFSELASNLRRQPPAFSGKISDGHIHAEMRLLALAADDTARSTTRTGFIATSKLMCSPCDEAVKIVSEVNGANITTVGTHGKTYPGWKYPPAVEGEILSRIEAVFTSLHEQMQTGEITRTYPMGFDEPLLLSERGNAILQAASERAEARRKKSEADRTKSQVAAELGSADAFPSLAALGSRTSVADSMRASATAHSVPSSLAPSSGYAPQPPHGAGRGGGAGKSK